MGKILEFKQHKDETWETALAEIGKLIDSKKIETFACIYTKEENEDDVIDTYCTWFSNSDSNVLGTVARLLHKINVEIDNDEI